MSHLSNYPAGVTGWDIENLSNGYRDEEVETLCSECGMPCDDPTCLLCLEGIAEMIALMEPEDKGLNYSAVIVGFVLAILVCGVCL